MLYQTGTDMLDMFIKDSTDYAWYKGQIQGPYRTDARTFKDLTGLNQGPSRILSDRCEDLQRSYWTESRTFKDLIGQMQGPSRILLD